jgi:hypothetical protein
MVPRVEPTPAELAAADVVVLLTDHDAFDTDDIRSPRAARLRLPPPAGRPQRREPLTCHADRLRGRRPAELHEGQAGHGRAGGARRGGRLVHTGQHYDADMNDVFFSDLGIRPPDHYLQVGSGSHAIQTGKVMAAFEPLVGELGRTWSWWSGDVNSTLGCALVTAKSGALLAHVEAGCAAATGACPRRSTASSPTG